MKKAVTVFLSLLILISLSACNTKAETNNKRELKQIYEYVYDAGTYTELDYKFAEEFFLKEHDNWGGGCSAIAKTISNGNTIVGRNMDLNISNKVAYVFRTEVPGCYKTLNTQYTFRDLSPDKEVIDKNGLPEDFEKILPFMADDVLNEKGLYVEVNMRPNEFWPTGEAKYSCSGTNPNATEKVYMFTLARYIGEHCANVDEAIEYVKTLNIYSEKGYWNYCFLMADESGHYGLLEFGENEIFWNDYQPCQTNFYVNETLESYEELPAGIGRYGLLMKNIDDVDSEEDMLALMKRVNYFQFYDLDKCEFDPRSEVIGSVPFATLEFVYNDDYQEFILEEYLEANKNIKNLTRQEMQDANTYWETTFTEVANCNTKELFIRFFEDDNQTYTLKFN